jgi:hypothetical protein
MISNRDKLDGKYGMVHFFNINGFLTYRFLTRSYATRAL